MKYTRAAFRCENPEQVDIIVAALSDLPFDSFEEAEGNVLYAYCDGTDVYEEDVKRALESFLVTCPTEITHHQRENWNKTWEASFEPVAVENRVYVRATFHEPPEDTYDYDLVIDPKMSFGTGHHQTTHLMLAELHAIKDNIEGAQVLDMGCGTGILGILAAKMGAIEVLGVDIDPWCVENSKENIELNKADKMKVIEGNVDALRTNEAFDIVLANINKNILLSDMDCYNRVIKEGGTILFSGIYEEDFDAINTKAVSLGLEFVRKNIRNRWLLLRYVKNA